MRTISQLLLTLLLNACWQIALITAIAAVCAWLLRGATARYRHLLWVIALAISFVLPLLTSLPLSSGADTSEPPRTVVQSASGGFVPAPELILDAQPSAPSSSQTTLNEAPRFIAIDRNVAAVVIVLYLLFLCYRSGKLFMAWRRARSLKRSARLIDLPESVRKAISECQTALGAPRVRVLCSTSITAPIAVGSFKPLIILPEPLLRETEQSVLTAAIGHELVHVLRRDYLLNLIYELISLPLSFHPGKALVKRRIRATRELGCDELVTEKLLDAAVYARSLVHLASSAVNMNRPCANITVGIADADILEERVMTILRRPKINNRRMNLSLVAALVIFLIPCFAAAPFALRISINPRAAAEAPEAPFIMPPASVEMSQQDARRQTGQEKQEREEQKRRELLEEKLEREQTELEARSRKLLTQDLEAQIKEASRLHGQAKEELVRRLMEASEVEGRAKEELVRKLMEASEVEGRAKEELVRKLMEAGEVEGRAKEELGRKLMESQRGLTQEREERRKLMEAVLMAGRQQELELRKLQLEMMARQQAQLAKKANITMQQAIQIAMSQQAGTVMECRLVGKGPPGERDQVFYALTIVSGDEPKSAMTRMLISAIDGRVVKTWKDEK